MGWLKNILTMFAGGVTREGGALDKAMSLVAERTEDIDKRNAAIVELYKLQLQAEQNPVWLPALQQWPNLTAGARIAIAALIWSSAMHKLGRMVMWAGLVVIAAPLVANGTLSVQELAVLMAGPGTYTILKGRGR